MPNKISEERISQKLSAGTTPKKKGKLGVIIGAVTLVIASVIVVMIVIKPNKADSRNTVVTPDNVDEILADLQDTQKTETGRYQVTMNTTWDFDNGSSASSNAYVENSTANNNAVYFDIVRSDTGETIFKSPTIPVGSHLEDITLDKELPKGSYSCVLTYHLLDDSGKSVSKLNINLTINVKN